MAEVAACASHNSLTPYQPDAQGAPESCPALRGAARWRGGLLVASALHDAMSHHRILVDKGEPPPRRAPSAARKACANKLSGNLAQFCAGWRHSAAAVRRAPVARRTKLTRLTCMSRR